MSKSTKKWLIGTGIVAAGATAVAAGLRAISHYFVKIAMDRKCPGKVQENISMVSGGSVNEELLEQTEQATRQLESAVQTRVEAESHDGLRLIGHWYPAEQPKRILIAMHGWRSSWSRDFGVIAPFWHDNGCSVLYAEQRGQGASEGEYMGFGMLERYDCLKWAQWANEYNPDNLPIYLVGLSMGATTVLMAGDLELPENVRGIMADCGFTSAHDIWKHVAEENLHLHYGLYATAANDLCKKRISIGSRECSTVDVLKQCKVPVLFIHGADDNFVPVRMTYENYAACTSEKHLLIIPGADHAMSYCVDTKAYQEENMQFWEKFDNK